jgi:hypothetical protein
MENTNLGLEEISEDETLCLEDIRRLLRDAYQQGFEDGMSFLTKDESNGKG